MELNYPPSIKTALLVSVPGFPLSNINLAEQIFQITLKIVILSAVGCTGCAHNNGSFNRLPSNDKVLFAEFFHESNEMLRHHQIRLGIKRIRNRSN
tara:strand:- start:420 stop:707 length:288 start_codon:yes stop_codon:yes gene_type:complete